MTIHRPANLPPQTLRRSLVVDLPPDGARCQGCLKPFEIGATVFYRLASPYPDKLLFCPTCGDSAIPYIEETR